MRHVHTANIFAVTDFKHAMLYMLFGIVAGIAAALAQKYWGRK